MDFESPWVLAAIPVLLLLLLFSRRLTVFVGSRSVFMRERAALLRRAARRFFWLAPYALMLLGALLSIIAHAAPKQAARQVISHEIEMKTAVLIDDVSGSMGTVQEGAPALLEVLKAANRSFIEEFCRKERDSVVDTYVGLVTFSNEASVRAMPTKDCAVVTRRISTMRPDTSTSIDRGLWVGLALVIEFIDKGQVISSEEMQKVKVSLKEREAYIPLRAQEFCAKYPGLSLILYTDGDFPAFAETRQKALEETSLRKSQATSDLNPFHIIDIAHALCIRTYFYSVGQILPAYRHAFTTPEGLGEVQSVLRMSPAELADLYRAVAERERSRVTIEEEITYNPLMESFDGWALLCFAVGAFLAHLKIFSRHHARIPERR